MIKHVIVDVGEVLVNGLYGAEKHISEAVGQKVTNRQLQTQDLGAFFKGFITEDELWRRMSDQFGWKVSIDALKTAVRRNFTEVPGTRDVVVELRRNASGARSMSILSVHGREWIEWIQDRYHINELFDFCHYSYETAIPKPDDVSFIQSARRAGARLQDCLVIDDYYVNTDAATKLGCTTHLFKSATDLQSWLRIYGLIP